MGEHLVGYMAGTSLPSALGTSLVPLMKDTDRNRAPAWESQTVSRPACCIIRVLGI